MKSITIFNYKLATLLVQRGQKMIKSLPNFKCPGYYVYYFDDNEAVRAIIEEFKNK